MQISSHNFCAGLWIAVWRGMGCAALDPGLLAVIGFWMLLFAVVAGLLRLGGLGTGNLFTEFVILE